MGAGSITSNVKSDKTLVVVRDGKEEIATGRKKFGAMLISHDSFVLFLIHEKFCKKNVGKDFTNDEKCVKIHTDVKKITK